MGVVSVIVKDKARIHYDYGFFVCLPNSNLRRLLKLFPGLLRPPIQGVGVDLLSEGEASVFQDAASERQWKPREVTSLRFISSLGFITSLAYHTGLGLFTYVYNPFYFLPKGVSG